MYNHEHEFEQPSDDILPNSFETPQVQSPWMWVAGGLSILFGAAATILFLVARRQRRPARLRQAEASLIAAASRAEQAARTVRKQGPGLVERGAGRVEQAARTVRK